MTIEALPLSSYSAVAATAMTSAGPASFADVVDHVKGAVVSVKVKIDETNVSDDGDAQPMPNIPKGGPLESSSASSARPAWAAGSATMSRRAPHAAWPRVRASSSPPTAIS